MAQASAVTLPLAERLDISTAESTREGWTNWLEENLSHEGGADEVVVEACNLERVDFAGIQLLFAVTREIVSRGAVVRWSGVTEGLREASSMLGLLEDLGLEIPLDASEGSVR